MSFGLYLHFPFCRNKCAYCDFYKEVHDVDLEVRFYEALEVETRLAAEALETANREISTLYVGGGTPSLANLRLFGDWLEQLQWVFSIPRRIEFSFECNPESVDKGMLEELRRFGVNRPIFGMQSFNQKLLKTLGRTHRVRDSHRAVYLANALGFDNFGTDLIFGLPRQTGKLLSADLDHLVALDPPHISFYQLTVEPGTVLADKVEAGRLKMPDDELSYAMYRGGVEYLTECGYERYEVSSFAKPGFECRHNQGYWEGKDYLGLGPSAHSFMGGRRFANSPDFKEYVVSLDKGDRPLVVDESGTKERIVETIMLGLRTSKGIDRRAFKRQFGNKLDKYLKRNNLDILLESGHLLSDVDGLRLTDEGFFLADEIIGRLVK